MCCHLDAPCLAASHVPAQIYAKIQEGVFDVSNETFGIRVVRIMLPFLWLAVAVGCAVPRAACRVLCRVPPSCLPHAQGVRAQGRQHDPVGVHGPVAGSARDHVDHKHWPACSPFARTLDPHAWLTHFTGTRAGPVLLPGVVSLARCRGCRA